MHIVEHWVICSPTTHPLQSTARPRALALGDMLLGLMSLWAILEFSYVLTSRSPLPQVNSSVRSQPSIQAWVAISRPVHHIIGMLLVYGIEPRQSSIELDNDSCRPLGPKYKHALMFCKYTLNSVQTFGEDTAAPIVISKSTNEASLVDTVVHAHLIDFAPRVLRGDFQASSLRYHREKSVKGRIEHAHCIRYSIVEVLIRLLVPRAKYQLLPLLFGIRAEVEWNR